MMGQKPIYNGVANGFENLVNFRDVGKSINSIVGKKVVVENRLFRSARPDDSTVEDRRRLREDYAVKTIMDLRTPTEHAVQVKRRQARLRDPSLLSTEDVTVPVKIPGIEYVEINIHGRYFEMNMLWKLSFYDILRVITFIAMGRRLQGANILVKEAIQPRGLYGLAYDTLDYCGVEIAHIFAILSAPDNYPLLIHCTQGKDRTGAIVALLLFLLDEEIPVSAITADYMLSEGELLPEKELRLAEIREIGLSDDFASCPRDWIEKLEEHLRVSYGGVRGYLGGIGVGEEALERVVGVLKGC